MKKAVGGATKTVAAVIIGLVLILMVGIVANGWQNEIFKGENSGEDSNQELNADKPNGDTDENSGTADNNTQNNETVSKPSVPELLSPYTGLEINEELVGKLPYAIVCEPNAPIYGISGSELTVEIPIENGKTRYIIYRNDISELGKIGSLSATRKYISQIAKLLGGILVAYGSDDIVSYDHVPSTVHIDMESKTDAIFKENGRNVYTDNKNLEKITNLEGIDVFSYRSTALPFTFCDYYSSVKGTASAKKITVPYSDGATELIYDLETKTYFLIKNGKNKIDMLNGECAEYKNVFVLFSDMITYETSAGTETVVNTASRGTGYYVTDGTLIEIRWTVSSDGQLIFEDLNGEKLVVNRGNSFIGYYKSSDSFSVSFE